MDNRPLRGRVRDFDSYDDDSSERMSFKSKPFSGFGGDGGYSSFGSGYSSSKQEYPSFGGARAYATESVSSYSSGLGNTRPANGVYAKPKAVVRPKKTELENQPYITKGIGSLSKGAPVSDSLDYGVGDRVRHIKYGVGIVSAIEKGPRDYQVTVQFDTAGQKVMYAAFAKLKKTE